MGTVGQRHQESKMATLVTAPTPVDLRKKSLKEQPSYLKEVSVALSRREELLRLKERLSSAKLLLDADPSTKPWLLTRSISFKEGGEMTKEEAPKVPQQKKNSESSDGSSERRDLTVKPDERRYPDVPP